MNTSNYVALGVSLALILAGCSGPASRQPQPKPKPERQQAEETVAPTTSESEPESELASAETAPTTTGSTTVASDAGGDGSMDAAATRPASPSPSSALSAKRLGELKEACVRDTAEIGYRQWLAAYASARKLSNKLQELTAGEVSDEDKAALEALERQHALDVIRASGFRLPGGPLLEEPALSEALTHRVLSPEWVSVEDAQGRAQGRLDGLGKLLNAWRPGQPGARTTFEANPHQGCLDWIQRLSQWSVVVSDDLAALVSEEDRARQTDTGLSLALWPRDLNAKTPTPRGLRMLADMLEVTLPEPLDGTSPTAEDYAALQGELAAER